MRFPFNFKEIFGNKRQVLSVFRVIVQRDNIEKDKYYPTFISGSTEATFPWASPTARITVVTNKTSSETANTSPIRKGDLIRVQANRTRVSTERAVWQDIYEGRIDAISSSYGDSSRTVLLCRGHDEETLYRGITADYAATSKTTGTILSELQTAYLSRITDASPSLIDATNSSSVASFNVKGKTKYYSDVIREMERIEGYSYIYSVVPVYDADGNISEVNGSWQPVQASVTDKMNVIEGNGLIAASFETGLGTLVNDVTQFGAQGAPQKVGTASNAGSKTSYNTRHHFAVDTTISTDAMCTILAEGILDQSVDASNSPRGQVTIKGDPNVVPGMLVYIKIPSLELEGAAIDGNYRVRRVSHNINLNGWVTTLDVGDLILTDGEILADLYTKNRINNANMVE